MGLKQARLEVDMENKQLKKESVFFLYGDVKVTVIDEYDKEPF